MHRSRAALGSLVVGLLMLNAPAVGATGAVTPVNAGFEADGAAVASPSGWKSAGDTGADFTEAGGADSAFRLTHWSADDYAVERELPEHRGAACVMLGVLGVRPASPSPSAPPYSPYGWANPSGDAPLPRKGDRPIQSERPGAWSDKRHPSAERTWGLT